MNTNIGVKWRRFIVPKKVEKINGHLFIDNILYICIEAISLSFVLSEFIASTSEFSYELALYISV